MESRTSQHTCTSYVTESSVVSIADLNTEKCIGWQRGPLIDQGSFGKVGIKCVYVNQALMIHLFTGLGRLLSSFLQLALEH